LQVSGTATSRRGVATTLAASGIAESLALRVGTEPGRGAVLRGGMGELDGGEAKESERD